MFTNNKLLLESYINESLLFKNYDLICFIENEEDQRFWHFIINKALPDKKIEYISYSKTGGQGKKEILKFKEYLQEHSGKAIICIDSDYDYIRNIHNNIPFLYQTFTYSVENYLCHPHSLNELCSELLIPSELFDFVSFFSKYTETIKELLVLDILLNDQDTKNNQFYTADFNNNHLNNNGDSFLSEINDEIINKLKSLHQDYAINETKYLKIKQTIESDNILDQRFLSLYINGHTVFNLVVMILTELYSKYFSNKCVELKNTFSGKQLEEKINELKNRKLDLITALKLNYSKCYNSNNCNSMKKIIETIYWTRKSGQLP